MGDILQQGRLYITKHYFGFCCNVSGKVTKVQMGSTPLSCEGRKDVCSDPSVITIEPRSIKDLPDTILLNILSYIGPNDLCLIAKVCERWNALAKDVLLWKTLSYTAHWFSNIREIEEVLTNAPALHSFIINYRSGDVDKILKILFDKRVELRRLIIKCRWITDDYDLCAALVDLYPELEGLSLEGCCSIQSASFGHITRLNKLSELYLFDCKTLSGKTVRLIADSCQHVKKLSLGGRSQISDEDVIHVIDRLGKQLTCFVLNREGLTDVAYSHLKNCARLQELELRNCRNMTDRGLLEGIGALQDLTSLRFSGSYNLTAKALSSFLHRPSMSSMVLLELRNCSNLNNEGLKGIAERCIHLKELTITQRCNVTDAGVRMVISHCSQLRVLDLTRITSITGDGWMTQVPSILPHLKKLWLGGCNNVRDEYVAELLAAVPELGGIRLAGWYCGSNEEQTAGSYL